MSRASCETFIRELATAARDNLETRERPVWRTRRRPLGRARCPAAARGHSGRTHLDADLTVDATGRGSRMPVWLAQLDVEPPVEDRVVVNLHGTSFTVRRKPRAVPSLVRTTSTDAQT